MLTDLETFTMFSNYQVMLRLYSARLLPVRLTIIYLLFQSLQHTLMSPFSSLDTGTLLKIFWRYFVGLCFGGMSSICGSLLGVSETFGVWQLSF